MSGHKTVFTGFCQGENRGKEWRTRTVEDGENGGGDGDEREEWNNVFGAVWHVALFVDDAHKKSRCCIFKCALAYGQVPSAK